MPKDDTIRAFVAVWPPEEVRRLLGPVVDELSKRLPGYRWVKTANLHLTLEFLGNTKRALLPSIVRALDQIASDTLPFDLSLGRPGAFGSRDRARVLWIELSGKGQDLQLLAGRVSDALRVLGFSPDKGFVPHLTLARKKQGTGPFISASHWEELWFQVLKRAGGTEPALDRAASAPWTVSSLTLVESHLMPDGPRYEVQHVSPFRPVVREI